MVISFERAGMPSSSDVENINRLLIQLAKKGTAHKKTDGTKLVRTVTASYFYVARDKSKRDQNGLGKIIGMACLSVCPPPSGWYGIIDDVVVDENGYLRQGIAAQLMQKLIKQAKKLGLKRIDLHSHPSRSSANKMYLKLGFEMVVEGDAEKDTSNQYRLRL